MIAHTRWPAIATVLVVALAGIGLQPVTLLQVVASGGEVLACQRVAPSDTATLVFTHSMYGGEVRESWQARDGALARVRIETDNAAAAEYYATDGRVARTEGGFEVIASPIVTDALPIRVDRVGNHRLRIGDEEIALATQVDGSVRATMTSGRVPLLQYVFDRHAGCRS